MTPQELLERIEQAKRDGDTELVVVEAGLTELPPEIGQLAQLEVLRVSSNRLTSLPPEIGQLAQLKALDVGFNQLTSLPPEIGNLKQLKMLLLYVNRLQSLPTEIGQLTGLTDLHLVDNRLESLPAEIGRLQDLETLSIGLGANHTNAIAVLPPELGLLDLDDLSLDGLPLTDPPPEIVKQGTKAVLAYLRGKLEEERPLWESKLLVVGEGAVGKTQLLRALRGDAFQPKGESETTWGIDIHPLELPHPRPDHEEITMTLRCWDFGGQNIYHATHQFFLTTRSMFLLVWNARMGWEQGKLHYWLDTIQALAPDSPVLLVATHIDERPGGLPLDDLIDKYPQIVGEWSVSNARRDLNDNGIERLREAVALAAATLPLMGAGWPGSYWKTLELIRAATTDEPSGLTVKQRKSFLKRVTDRVLGKSDGAAIDGLSQTYQLVKAQKYIPAAKLWEIMDFAGVATDSRRVLAEQLHQLGEILYFQQDELIADTVFLDPSWVTKRISEVLVHEGIVDGLGIFTREHMQQCWSDLDRPLQDDLLRLMEHFDLSYEIPDDPDDRSLVVERLALDPAPYEDEWNALSPESGSREIRMKFDLQSTRPAGIPGWFIARSHRFTTHMHWKYGALFGDDRRAGQRRHLALLRSSSQFEHVELSVRGPNPQSFFSVLRDGLELTFDRFPGLKIRRTLPCPECPTGAGDPDRNEFDLTHLEKRLTLKTPKQTIECPQCLVDVSVVGLLFGLHWATEDAVLDELNQRTKRIEDSTVRAEQQNELILNQLSDLRALTQRQFTYQFNRDQRLDESHCPRVFSLRPRETKSWPQLRETLFGTKWTLQLYCEEPGCWHPAPGRGEYTIDEPAAWQTTLAPYVGRLVKVFKYAAPLVAPGLGYLTPEVAQLLSSDVKLMTALVDVLPDVEADGDLKHEYELTTSTVDREKTRARGGASLRSLRQLLLELDPSQKWGGLTKTITPEGHWLWLCDEHRKPYVRCSCPRRSG